MIEILLLYAKTSATFNITILKYYPPPPKKKKNHDTCLTGPKYEKIGPFQI